MFLLEILVITFFNEVISDIQCHPLCIIWLFIFIIETKTFLTTIIAVFFGGGLSYDSLQLSYSWYLKLASMYNLLVYIYQRDKLIPPKHLLSSLLLFYSLGLTIYKEVIPRNKWWIICTTWWFISILETNKYFWQLC